MTATAEWAGAAQLRADLALMGLPDHLRNQIDWRESQPWIDPSQPGCGAPCGLGTSRIAGQFRLAEWAAAGALGHIGPTEAAVLDASAERLRTAGEGCRVLWHLELIHDGWLGRVRGPKFAVEDLFCVGPYLPADLIAEIDTRLTAVPHGWGRHDAVWTRPIEPTTNAPATVAGVRCWCTYWTAEINYG